MDARTGQVVADIYRKTAGRPVGATKSCSWRSRDLPPSAAASTLRRSSAWAPPAAGRKLVGEVVGADAIVNEITAPRGRRHARRPDVDTIFEIGGQDSKYMRVARRPHRATPT